MAPLLSLPALVCVAAAVPAAADFRAVEFLPGGKPCSARLTTPVPFKCTGQVAKEQSYSFWKTHLDFDFGLLGEPEWRALRQQYAAPWAGPSILRGETALFEPYSAARRYNLLDFLPVTIRALVDHTFAEEDEPLPAGEPLPPVPPAAPHLTNYSVLAPNCWGTVYEVLRTVVQCRGDDVGHFHDVYSTDDKDAQAWLETSTSPVPGPYTDAKRKFGDILSVFLRDKEMKRPVLQHTVVVIDQDVVFEKAGTGDKNPFRLTDVATVEEEWRPVAKGGLFEWELRRPHLASDQLETFAQRFSLSSREPDARWPQFWRWPSSLQRWFALGVGDNPRKPPTVDALVLLRARRYVFRRNGEGRWEMFWDVAGLQQQGMQQTLIL